MANITLGSINTFASHAAYNTKCCQIDTNRYVVCWLKDIGALQAEIWATIYDVNPDNSKTHLVTQKITTSYSRIMANAIDICSYNTNKWVVLIRRWLDGFEVGSFYYNGSVIVDFGSHYNDSRSNQTFMACTDIATNKIVISTAGPSSGSLWCMSLVSDIVTYDYSWVAVDDLSETSLTKIDENKFLCAYHDKVLLKGRAIMGSTSAGVTNRTISLGSIIDINGSNKSYYIGTCGPSPNKAIVTFDSRDDGDGRAVAITAIGNTITAGSPTQFESGATRNTSCCKSEYDAFVVAYVDNGASLRGRTCLCKVDWVSKVITPETPEFFEDSATGGGNDRALDICNINDDQIAISYQDDGDNDYGKSVVGTFLHYNLDAPDTVVVTAGIEKNTITWNSASEADSDNLYWSVVDVVFPNDTFENLDNWTINTLNGAGATVTIDSNQLKIYIPDAVDGYIVMTCDSAIPSEDFTLDTDITDYVPDDDSDGHDIFWILGDSGRVWDDRLFLHYWVSDSGNTYNLRYLIEVDSDMWLQTITISGRPTKFRAVREGNIFRLYYYLNEWIYVDGRDFGIRADNIVELVLQARDRSLHGGTTKLDNLLYRRSLKEDGTQITSVTSPYEHSSLTFGETYYYTLTSVNVISESEDSEEVDGIQFYLESPISPYVEPGINENTVSWKSGPSNEYFNMDLSEWTVTKTNGSETATIINENVVLDLPDSIDSNITLTYNDKVSIGNFVLDLHIDQSYGSGYKPDATTGPFLNFIISDDADTNIVRVEYYRTGVTNYAKVYWRVDGIDTATGVHATNDIDALRIKRIGNTFRAYFKRSSETAFTQFTGGSKDFSTHSSLLSNPIISFEDNTNRGGSIIVQDFVIVSERNYFPNDTFENLDNWTILGDELAEIIGDRVRLTVADADEAEQLLYEYSLFQNDFTLIIDLINYVPNDSDNGVNTFFRVFDNNTSTDNYFYINFKTDNGSPIYNVRTSYKINGGSALWGSINRPTNLPTKFKIERDGNYLKSYYYDTDWVLMDSIDFGIYASEIGLIDLEAWDNSLNGGYIEYDNLSLNGGINTYNLYWKKDKCPNCYFYNLDNWEITKQDGSEAATIVSNKLHVDIPNTTDAEINIDYDYVIPSGDFDAYINFSNYTPDSANGFKLFFKIKESSNIDEAALWYRSTSAGSGYLTGGYFKDDGVVTNISEDYPTILPSSLRVRRIGTILYVDYYTDSWINLGSQDLGVRAANITNIEIYATDEVLVGGSVDVDYLITTPSVKDDYDGKISDIIDLDYIHESLDGSSVYCYEITSEGSESEASEEVYGLTTPDAPTNFSVVEGYEKNTISWDSVTGADSYNIYWAIDYYPNEYFGNDLSNWTTYKLQGGEYVEIVSNKLKTELYDSVSTGWNLIHDTVLPINGFILEIDMDTYTPSDNSNGHYVYFYVVDSYGGGTDYAYIRYHVTGAGATHNIRTNLVLSGSDDITDITISGTPTKFRIKRVGNIIEVYYYISNWVLVDSLDFGARASLLDYAQLSGVPNSGNGGITEFDNIVYWPDLKENGTKITGVISPYEHNSLTKDQSYYYVVVSENISGESDSSIQELGVPFGLPDPPTGISIVGGSGQNTINFTDNPLATETHIYWDTSPIVTIGDSKIADVASPYIHDDLDPSPMYYYILTSENAYGEGIPSSEYNSSPWPETPTGIGAIPGIEKNTVAWTSVTGADSYNIYWKDSSGVTKANGTKIAGVTSPYIHTGLAPYQSIYYVVTAEDEDGESDISSEVTASPFPPEDLNLPQEPVDQYTILSTFSENTKDNLSKLAYPMIGTPPVSGYNKLAGDLYDLYEDIDFNSCLTDNSFDIEEVDSTSIKVLTGRCIIGGVCIDIKEDKILNIDDENSYFNWVDVITGAGIVYILIYYDYNYDVEVDTKQAYIGLMKKTDYEALTTEQKEYYCLLGAIKVNSSVEIISPLYYWDPDDTSQNRPHPKGFADGGWLDLPEEYII